MVGSINSKVASTNIALIPKKDEAEPFLDYRPISLCIISYKIIAKIIAERIKDFLSTHISSEQHAFLKGRNIQDAVASTQEGLFTIQKRKRNATILKIDLQKAYDCLDWGFLRCLLVKIGLNTGMTNWIMACVELVNFSVIINGIPSPFFSTSRGLRQGCRLSPILFILAMNTLSLHIKKAVEESKVYPLKVCRGISIYHNLFVDDIILFGML